MFLKFGGVRVSAPQESAGGMRGGNFLKILTGTIKTEYQN